MAWTAPRTWVVSEIVTAALMNTHVRDNLAYLKGQAGTVAIEDAITVAGTVAASTTGGNALSAALSATTGGLAIVMANVASQNAQISLTNTGQRNALIYMDRAADKLKISQNGTANPAISIDGNGQVGIGAATTPRGALEARGASVGGMLFYADNAIGGSAVTLVADAPGDAASGIYFFSHCKRTGSTYQQVAGTFVVAGAGDQSIFTDGGANILVIRAAASGAVTLVRTAGTGTYDVSLFLMWL